MAKTTIKARLDVEKWTGSEFEMNIERAAEITLPLEVDNAKLEAAIDMVLEALRTSGKKAINDPKSTE